MSTLLIRLAGPMQSWGGDSKFDIRDTEREPTKSGVIGMLAAALGIRRDDKESLSELSKLKYGVRADREGLVICDFHTVHGTKNSYVTRRYYLNDALFLAGLECEDEETLKKYEYALKHPVYPLFLGRRSCPVTLPLVIGIRKGSLADALENEPLLCNDPVLPLRIVADGGNEGSYMLKKDVPVSFSSYRREFKYRKLSERFIKVNTVKETEHDPFSELEANDVSDANEA